MLNVFLFCCVIAFVIILMEGTMKENEQASHLFCLNSMRRDEIHMTK